MTHTMRGREPACHKRLIFSFFHSIRPISHLPFGALNSELASGWGNPRRQIELAKGSGQVNFLKATPRL